MRGFLLLATEFWYRRFWKSFFLFREQWRSPT